MESSREEEEKGSAEKAGESAYQQVFT